MIKARSSLNLGKKIMEKHLHFSFVLVQGEFDYLDEYMPLMDKISEKLNLGSSKRRVVESGANSGSCFKC